MSILSRSRVVAVGLGAGLALATTAFAAVTLSMSIGGTTAIAASDSGGSSGGGGGVDANLRVISINAVPEGPADCKASTNGGRDIVIRATVAADQGAIPEQRCYFRFMLKNEGSTPVRDIRINFRDGQQALQGWTVEDRSPQSVGPDALAGYEIEMTPASRWTQHLGTGAFVGVLEGAADSAP